jgi:hypothetical protein
MLQPAGDLRLGDGPFAAGGVVGVLLEDLLQRHLAVQLGIEGGGAIPLLAGTWPRLPNASPWPAIAWDRAMRFSRP